MLKSLAEFSSFILLGNLLTARVHCSVIQSFGSYSGPASKWSKDDNNLQFRGSDIRGFHISYFSNNYDPDYDYTGLVFHDIGTCTRREAGICGQMKNGYVVFYKDEDLIEIKNDEGLNSLDEAALKKVFKKLSVEESTRLITHHGLMLARFNIKGGVLSTMLSSEFLRKNMVIHHVDGSGRIENSLSFLFKVMNAYEYVLFDTIRYLWVENGKRQTIMVPKLQRYMEERAEDVLKSVASLEGAELFRQEYAPNAKMPDDNDQDCDEYDEGCDKGCDEYTENCDKGCDEYDEGCDQDGGEYDEDSDEEGKDYDEDYEEENDYDEGSEEEGFDYNENIEQ